MRVFYACLLLLAAVLAYALARSGGGNDGIDEFGRAIVLEGVLREHPYPLFEVRSADGSLTTWLLSSTGKAGAAPHVAGRAGQRARVRGARIYRDGLQLFEVEEVLSTSEEVAPSPPAYVSGGVVALDGEIVDTKCALGRMKPGRGTVHRECAIRCIAGGIPPSLQVVGANGKAAFLLLEGPDGGPLRESLLPFVGLPVRVTGERFDRGGLPVLRLDPDGITRLTRN